MTILIFVKIFKIMIKKKFINNLDQSFMLTELIFIVNNKMIFN